MYKIKIIAKTPKGKAKRSFKSFKRFIIGGKYRGKLLEEGISPEQDSFYFILNVDSQQEIVELGERCIKADYKIKQFFSTIFKITERLNKLMNKFQRSVRWFRRMVIRRLRKVYKDGEMIKSFENMSDEEFKDFFNFRDKEEMQQFLKQDLIILKII